MIHTLRDDIYNLVGGPDAFLHTGTDEFAKYVSALSAVSLQRTLARKPDSPRRGLRLSGMGPRCDKVLWLECNAPELAETLPPWAKIKFAYGDIIEALILGLVGASGHELTGVQDELVLDGIVGHRDCVVDGCVCDVKSCSSRVFAKFKTGSIALDDPFGYLAQLDGYVCASAEDPLVRVKDKGYIIAVDKTLGHIHVYEHKVRPEAIKDRIAYCKQIVGRKHPPDCTCQTKSWGKSGNLALDTKASYSPFKHICFPGLRTFLYADGPVFLSKVVKKPDVTEVDKQGKIVYN